MHEIHFTPRGNRELRALPKEIQQRIVNKLRENATLTHPLVRAAPVVNLPPATHRFRVGKYRVSFYIESGEMFVERVELRGQAYRK